LAPKKGVVVFVDFLPRSSTKREIWRKQLLTNTKNNYCQQFLQNQLAFFCGPKSFFRVLCVVSFQVYLDYLKWEIDTESAFLELPLTILVLVSFAMLAMNILHQEFLSGDFTNDFHRKVP